MFKGPLRIPQGNDFTLCFPWYERTVVDSQETLEPMPLEEFSKILVAVSSNVGNTWSSVPSTNVGVLGNRIYVQFKAGAYKGFLSFRISAIYQGKDVSCSWFSVVELVRWTNSTNYSEFIQGSPYLMPSNIAVMGSGTYYTGPLVTLNGEQKVYEANFYAPVLPGETGQILRSNGENQSPEWFMPENKDQVTVIEEETSITIDYTSSHYIDVRDPQGNLEIIVDSTDEDVPESTAKEVVVRVTDLTSDITLTIVSGDGLTKLVNFFDSDAFEGVVINSGKTVELVFTFWSKTDVIFNGGISL